MLAFALWEQLEEQAKRLRTQGRNDLAEETLQVYRAILELLDQIAELLDGPMTAARFYQVLDEGFAARTIGVLPPHGRRAFVWRCADRLRPQDRPFAAVGRERRLLPPARHRRRRAERPRRRAAKRGGAGSVFRPRGADAARAAPVLRAAGPAQKSLYASCAQSDDEGRPLQSAPLFDALCAMFPTAEQEVAPPPFLRPIDPEEGFAELLAALRTLVDTGGESLPEGLLAAYAAYSADPRYAGRLCEAEARLFEQPGLGREEAKALYGPFRGSTVTRLEQFSRCPFAFLVSRGCARTSAAATKRPPATPAPFTTTPFAPSSGRRASADFGTKA